MRENEPKRKYRPFQVCYNNFRCVSSMTKEELIENIEDVNWVNYQGKRFDIEKLRGGDNND